jgi:signal transduction histidine kinase
MKRKIRLIRRDRQFELELKQIIEELKEDPVRKFNTAFALMGIIPILSFMYLLIGRFFSSKVLEGNVGLIVLTVVFVSLLGFLIGHTLIKSLLNRLIIYMVRLQEKDKQKSIFVANVSHEIKNPLAVLRLSLSNILDGLVGKIEEYQREIIKTCHDLCERLIRFATHTLDISKIEAGKIELKREYIELNRLIEEEIKVFEAAFNKKDIQCITNHPFPKVMLWADRDKMSRLVSNLIDNAIKYTPQGGKIFINLWEEERHVRLEVCDTGQGIPQDKKEKIFDKFERISSSEGGAGLGLAIAKDFVELHKGRIWVESKLGEGSKFIILLPKDLRLNKR